MYTLLTKGNRHLHLRPINKWRQAPLQGICSLVIRLPFGDAGEREAQYRRRHESRGLTAARSQIRDCAECSSAYWVRRAPPSYPNSKEYTMLLHCHIVSSALKRGTRKVKDVGTQLWKDKQPGSSGTTDQGFRVSRSRRLQNPLTQTPLTFAHCILAVRIAM